MFIRYNDTGKFWEYDTSAAQSGAGPWLKLQIDYSQLINVPAASLPAHHLTHQPGGSDPLAVDAAAATGSLRTLGTGALQAAPGNDIRFSGPQSWTSIPHAGLTFSSNAGTWVVDAADLSYFKYAKIGSLLFIKGAITATTPTSAGTELRVAGMPGFTVAGNDSFGFTVYTNDGFGTQDTGQVIARAATNLIAFKQRTGAAWPNSVNQTGIIFNFVVETAP